MTTFTESYFTMTETDAIIYAKDHLTFFSEDAELSCKEIGDGNLNYVFRLVDSKSGDSLIIKQAGPVARISDEFKVSPDRNRIEHDILKIQGELVPEFVPEVYHYDPIMNCTAMQDLSNYTILRKAFLTHQTFPQLADHVSSFLVNTLLLTSDLVLGHKEKKDQVKAFINPELCEITEDLVYTEPFYDCPRNEVFEGTLPFVREEIWSDETLKLETAKLKFQFLTKAQSLIHGDFHTGSIFVTEDQTKVIDAEFAFYGPAGYDIGNIIANLIFAYVNGEQTIYDPIERERFTGYILTTIQDIINQFKEKFTYAFFDHVTERVAEYPGFLEHYLEELLADTAAVCGLELSRRVIGLAPVQDLTDIADPDKRAAAEIACLKAAKVFILNRHDFFHGEDFTRVLQEHT
ncbi:S-methyl-5-thioribose kinase [Alkalicoccobacillus porphyridii]|uniref:S-methyl-5-thioribose kinase n=1 Tax=Alkalicoccobacillus porphyridii TaxID=2597270 RepID=A0A553ZXL0_9BACI|nr:S-methyl-5-thioribose kinase [Alkalicoccobacillus porphyridii]TSB46188.1 S-methyl-5-thioribose kinase [Alkalicoccobacillus porphyridii]